MKVSSRHPEILSCFQVSVLSYMLHTQAQAVKNIERTTNHDVKAIEYMLKDQFKQNAEVTKVSDSIESHCL